MRLALAAAVIAILWSTQTPASTPAEILNANHAASGGDAWKDKVALKTGYEYAGQGLTGTANGTTDLRDGRYSQFSLIGPQKFGRGFDGAHSWIQDNSGIVTLQDGADARQLAVNAAYRNANQWWTPDRGGATLTLAAPVTRGDRRFDVMTVVPSGGEQFEAAFDARTHLLAWVKEYYGEAFYTTTYENYRSYDGVMLAVDQSVGSGNPQYDRHFKLTMATFLKVSDASSYAPPPSAQPNFAFAGGTHQTTIPFELNNNHTHAAVMINGKGPFLLLFDTGSQNLITPEVARQLGLTVQGHSEMRGAGEGALDWGLTTLRDVRIGGVTLKNELFGVIPLHGLYGSNGIEMQGMIGSETFRRFVTRVDYGANTYTLIDPKYFDPADAGVRIKVAFDYNAVVADGSFDGVAGKFQVDSGSRFALTLAGPFAQKNGLTAKYAGGVDAVNGWGLGGPTRAHTARGGDLKIGDIEIKNLVFAIGTDKAGAFADPSLAGFVGGGFLKRYVVTYDYAHAAMYLKPTATPAADIDTYDRAGMWFNAAAREFDIVAVTGGGPAQQAGLREGDAITAIDGKPVVGNSLSDVRMRLRNDPPGTIVAFTILRGGKQIEVKVTLRDLV